MLTLLVVLCFNSVFGVEITRDTLPTWLSDRKITELSRAYSNLDYNNDGYVSFGELKLGLVSNLDHKLFNSKHSNNKDNVVTDTSYNNWFKFKPESFSCVPTMDPVDFVDCIVLSARHSTANISPHSAVLFETALSMYLGHECTDISPISDLSCEELMESDTMTACASTDYCQLSCYQCNIESHIFGLNIRGLNNERKENSVSKVYHPSNLKKHKKLLASSHSRNVENIIDNDKEEEIESNAMRRLLENSDIIENDKSDKKVFHNLGSLKSRNNKNNKNNELTSCKMAKKEFHANSDRFLFISDAHIEPWYDISGSGQVSRFTDVPCTIENMFTCHDSSKENAGEVSCTLNGESDLPIDMYETALDAMSHRLTRLENSVLFFVGDLQAHDYTDGVESPLLDTMTALMERMLDSTFKYFSSDQIFITPGNNDASHNTLFITSEESDHTSLGWAQLLISKDIVNNDLKREYSIDSNTNAKWTQTDLFANLGYYIKQLPEHGDDLSNTYVIVVNTNLGSSHYLQSKVLEYDLEWIKNKMNGKAIILAHHPNVATSMIPNKYINDNFILGIFSGHVHYFSETDENGFTILPALSQYAYVNAIASADLDTKSGKLNINADDLLIYEGVKGETANYACWTNFKK